MDENKLWFLTTKKTEIESELKRIPERLERAREQEKLAVEAAVLGDYSRPLSTQAGVKAREEKLRNELVAVEAMIAELKEEDRLDKLEQSVQAKRRELSKLEAKRVDTPGVTLEREIEKAAAELKKAETELREKRPDSPVINPVGWMEVRRKRNTGLLD